MQHECKITVLETKVFPDLQEKYLANPKSGPCPFFKAGDTDSVVGGVGLAEFEGIEDCAELQKLYLDDSVKGRGLSYDMMRKIETAARELGYKRMYLETHNNLKAAIHLYEKCGYKEIERPKAVVHSTMNRFFLNEFKGGDL